MSRLRMLVCGLAACLLVLAPATASAKRKRPIAHAAAACAGADLTPTTSNAARVGAATLCLINAQRSSHGLGALREDGRLDHAAADHTTDMVRRRYFDHNSPGGSTLVSRLSKVRYLSSHIAWSVGENIGWGGGAAGTPRSLVAMWMASPPHRANILNGAYRDIGLGVVAGTPRGGHGATYTTDFGRRG